MKRFKVLTFGCQMNDQDSEKMSGLLVSDGLHKVDSVEDADLVIVNTCSIREKAEQKFYSELGKLRILKIERPSIVIAVSGCIAQQEGAGILKRAPYVDIVFGNQNIKDLPGLIKAKRTKGVVVRTAFPDGYEHENFPERRPGGIAAFVNIMFGCDNFCSYCVVPLVRGREKSRRPGDVVGEVAALVSRGCREVTLLGQNVNSYGHCGFPELLRMVDGVDGLERIRFVTSHPKDLSSSLVDAMASLPKVCENIHLPLQSGSDRVLAAMNRRYMFSEYAGKVDMLRSAMPDMGLSTDIIVGFPGETEDDYERTIRALEDIRFDGIFSFSYSKRPDTAAIRLPGHVPEAVKAARLERVIDLQNRLTLEKNEARVGRVEEVLVEGPDRSGTPGRLSGKTRTGKIVNFEGVDALVGRLVNVRIMEAKKHSLIGKMRLGDV